MSNLPLDASRLVHNLHDWWVQHRVVMLSWRKQQSPPVGLTACGWLSSRGRPSTRPPTCQIRTPVSCGTAPRWSVGLSRIRRMICAGWSRMSAFRLCLSLRTWPYRQPQQGSAPSVLSLCTQQIGNPCGICMKQKPVWTALACTLQSRTLI